MTKYKVRSYMNTDNKILETERLILRSWHESDAHAIYKYAKDPRIGPIADWPVHTDEEYSRQIIRDVLSAPETYAVVLKETGEPVGSVGLLIGACSNFKISDREGEIGYWIGVPYWGQGLIPEAVTEMLRHGFEDLKLHKIWCGSFAGNINSARVQDKCGFKYQRTVEGAYSELIGMKRDIRISLMTRWHWKWQHRKKQKENT